VYDLYILINVSSEIIFFQFIAVPTKLNTFPQLMLCIICFVSFSPRRLEVHPVEETLKTKCTKDCTNWLETYFNDTEKISKATVPNLCTVDQSQGNLSSQNKI